jgi:hypothetical protein
MTDINDIHADNPELLNLNPELAKLVDPKKRKISTRRNVMHFGPDGERYDSGLEAKHAQEFTLAVRSGEYVAYFHSLPVPLPGNQVLIIDHVLINKQFQLEVYDSKPYDEKTQRFRCEDDFIVKKKVFEDIYKKEIKLI